jgi:hypothetical protein
MTLPLPFQSHLSRSRRIRRLKAAAADLGVESEEADADDGLRASSADKAVHSVEDVVAHLTSDSADTRAVEECISPEPLPQRFAMVPAADRPCAAWEPRLKPSTLTHNAQSDATEAPSTQSGKRGRGSRGYLRSSMAPARLTVIDGMSKSPAPAALVEHFRHDLGPDSREVYIECEIPAADDTAGVPYDVAGSESHTDYRQIPGIARRHLGR